jgi:hypothetical protein
MFEKVLSIKNRMSQFRIWLRDWLVFLIEIILTHARIWRFKLKVFVKTFFSFTLTLIQLFIVLFLSFIFCSKSMFETQVKKLLSFIYIFSICILHCINDLIRNFINYMFEKVLSIKNRKSQFRICFSDWLKFLFYIILTHARIWRLKLKLCVKTFFSFTLTLIKLFIVLFLSFIFCSK